MEGSIDDESFDTPTLRNIDGKLLRQSTITATFIFKDIDLELNYRPKRELKAPKVTLSELSKKHTD